ncbi:MULTISPECIES: NAD(P)/FAD-dependent oxidoreductase [Nocardiaceae]|uniref:Monoamine oxidase n=1 Tax=Rhodococcoides corynebacterioides TaxID=53972 RepID=A0ABS2KZN4_9NOCA|nr:MULTISPECIES: NAD(P)/FAD-dependent oxidoreductase [Rhodococcus]MBM7417403.1 monoamine oxidase [Rhodococcus corynebacterioides]MBP1115657.1 monoamine oxidase [Rhodococcus sp. PvP016]
MSDERYDAVVIGAGIAGITAARDLTDRGRSVVVLEAGDRTGGRTYNRPFAGLDLTVDLGGSWINRSLQPHMRRETQRYAISVTEDPSITGASFYTGGRRRLMPVPADEISDLERALAFLRDASRRVDTDRPLSEQPITDFDVTPDEFFTGLELPELTRELLYGMISCYSGAPCTEMSMLHIVAQVAAYGHATTGFVTALTERFVGGGAALLHAMIDRSRLEVRLGHTVARIAQDSDGVTVSTVDGQHVDARVCVLATPTNVIRHIDIVPGLDAEKQKVLAHNHVSRATKACILVRNLGGRPFATGTGTFQMISHAYQVDDERDILYAFGCKGGDDDIDLNDRAAVRAAVHQYYPDTEVLAVDHHDWNADPLFDGTYRVDRAHEALTSLAVLNRPEDRIVLAGTDVDDSVWRTWMEGALNSAIFAAGHADARLATITSD